MNKNRITQGEYIFNKLREKIHNGEYKGGDQLPTEMELAEEYSVSRNTVRAAINRLVMIGMVESFQGKGTFVKENYFSGKTEAILPVILSEGSDYLTLMNLRSAIESQSAYLAAQRATFREIRQLDDIVNDLEEHKDDLKYYSENDIKIHSKIAEISGNKIFVSLLEMIREILKDVLEDFIMEYGNYESMKAHRDIVNAIKMADPEKARESMHKHMQTVINRYLLMPKEEEE